MNENPSTCGLAEQEHAIPADGNLTERQDVCIRAGIGEPRQGRAVALPHHPPGRHGRGTEMGGRKKHRPEPGQMGRPSHRRRKDTKTEVGWQSKDGQARIFLTIWKNDNEWYPVKDIEWILDDDAAALLIFGVTAK